jgi:phage gpG-like protein
MQRWSNAIIGLSTLTQDAAKDAVSQLQADLHKNALKESDPYGRKWKQRKHAYSHPILRKTGYLQSRTKVQLKGRGEIAATNDARYAVFHQRGTKNLAVRLIVPVGSRRLPASWLDLLRKAITKRWQQNFSKNGIRP